MTTFQAGTLLGALLARTPSILFLAIVLWRDWQDGKEGRRP